MTGIKRASAAIAVLSLAAATALFVMPRVSEATGRAVASGLGALKARLESAFGLSVSFRSLSPTILRSASLSSIVVSVPGGRTILSARKVRATYDLFALLRGRNSDIVNGLEFADVSLDIRLPEDGPILDKLKGLFSGEGGGGLPRLAISGRNVTAEIFSRGMGSASFTASSVGFSTLAAEPSVELDGRFAIDIASLGLGAISGPLSLSGSLSRDFARARLSISMAAESREVSLSTQRFELAYGEGGLVLTKVKDRAPLDATLRVDFKGGDSSISLKLDGYSPSSALKFSGRYAGVMPWLEIPYSGSLVLRSPDMDLSKLSYEASLSGELPRRLFSNGQPSASAELVARGDLTAVSVEKAVVSRGADRLAYSGAFRFADLSPDGQLDLGLSLMDGALGVSSSVRLLGHDGEYAALADEATIGGVTFKDLSFAAAVKGSQADYNLSFRPPDSPEASPTMPAKSYSGEAGASSGSPLVRCEGSASFGARPNVELSADLEAIDLGPLQPLLSILAGSPEVGSIASTLKLGGSLYATSDLHRLSWSAPNLTVVSRALPGAYALLSLSGGMAAVSVKRIVVAGGDYSVEGSGKVDFSEAGRLGFEANLALKDIPYALKGSIDAQGLFLTGDYGLSLMVRNVNGGTYASLKSRALPLPIGGDVYLASIDAEGRYSSIRDWEASVSALEVVPTGERLSNLPTIGLSGDFSPRSAELATFRVSDKYSSLSGKASLAYALAEPFSARLTAKLAADARPKPGSAAESYSIEASYADGKFAGSADLVASPLARLGKLPIEGSADGRITFEGSPDDPALGFSLKLRDGRYLQETLALSLAGEYKDKLLALRDVSAAYQGQSVSSGSGSFSFADAAATVAFDFSGSLLDSGLRCSVSATAASTRGPGGTLEERLGSYRAAGSLRNLEWGSVKEADWPFDASFDPKAISVACGSSREVFVKYGEGGSLSASLKKPFPVLAELTGLYDGKLLDVSVHGLDFDLGLLSPLLPPDVVQIRAGRASGGLHAIGLATDPEISGEIDLSGAAIRVPGWLTDDIGPFDGSIVALGRAVSGTAAAAKSGKGLVSLQVQAVFDHWLPANLTAEAKTIGNSTLKLDTTLLGIHAKGDAAMDIKFDLQGDVLNINPVIALDKASVIVSTDVLSAGSGGDPNWRPTLFLNVGANVRFGRGVQVFFPSEQFPVIAAYSDPSSSLAIRYDQTTMEFTLKGTVALRGGEVFYIQRNFFLKNGAMVFNESSDNFSPHVTLLAELRDRVESEDPNTYSGPVLITLRADNAPISSFTPRLSSTPPMTEAQIAGLMGQNLFGASAGKGPDLTRALISGTEFIPQLDMTRIIRDGVRDLLGLDMLYVRTHVLQQFILDVSANGTSGASGDRGSALSHYFDQTEIYAGKYFADSIFGHLSFSYSYVNDPLAATNTQGLESELGVELDTPFGLIQWSVAPQLSAVSKSLNNLLISDQSLSLSWKLSLP